MSAEEVDLFALVDPTPKGLELEGRLDSHTSEERKRP